MLKARNYFPPVKYGAKWDPSDIAGMIGLPYVGDIYYIDPTNGADTNGGTSQNDAFKTLTAAYGRVTDNHHDVIVLTPGGVGSGTGTVETAAITWSKNLVHLVGNVAPILFSSRARITCATASVSPFITVSGSGNSFHNVQITTSANTGLVTMKITGSRNTFTNCHIGGSNATAFDTATACDIFLSGGSENYFSDCVIGFDTISKTAACAAIITETSAARNVFDSCIFPMAADAAAPFFLKVPEHGLQTWIMFRGCSFINNTATGSTTMTDAISINADPQGCVVLQDCLKIGTTGWADTVAQVYAIGSSSAATYNQGIGFAVNPAA
jgi:hypothetical protein